MLFLYLISCNIVFSKEVLLVLFLLVIVNYLFEYSLSFLDEKSVFLFLIICLLLKWNKRFFVWLGNGMGCGVLCYVLGC